MLKEISAPHAVDCITCEAQQDMNPPYSPELYHLTKISVKCALADALNTKDDKIIQGVVDGIESSAIARGGETPTCDEFWEAKNIK
jgi:hypothetical protein